MNPPSTQPLFQSEPSILTKTEKQLIVNPPKEFKYDTTKIDEEYECPLCTWPLTDPMTHDDCGHTFCELCVYKLQTCPMCLNPLQNTLRPCKTKIVLNCLDKLEILCLGCEKKTNRSSFVYHYNEDCEIFCPNSCGEKIHRNTISQHWESCTNTIIQCLNKECTTLLYRKDLPQHTQNCPYTLQPCQFCKTKYPQISLNLHESLCDESIIPCQHCGTNFQKRNYPHHLLNCLEIPTQCQSHDLGCNFLGIRKSVLNHEIDCVLCKIRPMFMSLKDTVLVQGEAISELERKNTIQQKIIERQSKKITKLEKFRREISGYGWDITTHHPSVIVTGNVAESTKRYGYASVRLADPLLPEEKCSVHLQATDESDWDVGVTTRNNFDPKCDNFWKSPLKDIFSVRIMRPRDCWITLQSFLDKVEIYQNNVLIKTILCSPGDVPLYPTLSFWSTGKATLK